MGTLDGNNHTISGLDNALFDTNAGTIKNLALDVGISMDGSEEDGLVIGIFANRNTANQGIAEGKIINCKTTGSITITDDTNIQVGGISAINSSEIIACHSDVTINATSTGSGDSVSVGGIISNNMGTITASYFTGNISGKADTLAVGGIAVTNSSTISACYSTGILPTGAMAGGIAGNNSGTMEASYWSGDTANGVANGVGSGATQVDGSWEEPMNAMNTALSDNGIAYEYVQESGDVPLVIQPTA